MIILNKIDSLLWLFDRKMCIFAETFNELFSF